jgi:hypothetical protein
MRALIKRLAHYSRIDTPTIVSFVHFPVDPEPRTTLHVNSHVRSSPKVAVRDASIHRT